MRLAPTERDGHPRWLKSFVNPVKDKAAFVLESALVLEDVTERKRAEEALGERTECLIKNSSDIVPLLEVNCIIL